jgi:hypothetical protein
MCHGSRNLRTLSELFEFEIRQRLGRQAGHLARERFREIESRDPMGPTCVISCSVRNRTDLAA